jgi:hypothetical protein
MENPEQSYINFNFKNVLFKATNGHIDTYFSGQFYLSYLTDKKLP